MEGIYLDHAATTPVRPEVLAAMGPYFSESYGNPSSIHHWGLESAEAVSRGRQQLASLLGCEPSEVIFTSGGSESDNTAILGIAQTRREKGDHIITSMIEHHAVLYTCQALEKMGFRVTYLPVDSTGLVDPAQVAGAITDSTILVTIMHANNEIGTIQPVEEIGRICQERKVPFHCDAVQTVGHIPVKVRELNIDLLSLSGHKFHGPKGVGALYLRRGIKLAPLIHGGGHERGLRSGTENVPGIVGLGMAAELAGAEMAAEMIRQAQIRDRLISGLLERIPDSTLTGHPTRRLPNNASICVKYVEGESMLLTLDMMGIGASSGSACTSGSLEASHVLLACGLPHEVAHGSLRFSLGRDTLPEHAERVIEVLPGIVERLRAMSPLAGKVGV